MIGSKCPCQKGTFPFHYAGISGRGQWCVCVLFLYTLALTASILCHRRPLPPSCPATFDPGSSQSCDHWPNPNFPVAACFICHHGNSGFFSRLVGCAVMALRMDTGQTENKKEKEKKGGALKRWVSSTLSLCPPLSLNPFFLATFPSALCDITAQLFSHWTLERKDRFKVCLILWTGESQKILELQQLVD